MKALGVAALSFLPWTHAVAAQDWIGWDDLTVPHIEAVPLDDPARQWTLSVPDLTIGAIDGEDPYLFTHVWNALRTADGRIVVVESGSHEVRVFDETGRHVLTFGGRGDGPEEFGGPPWIALSGDHLRTWDAGHHRSSLHSLDGELLEQVTLNDVTREAGITPFPNGLVWEPSGSGQLWTGSVRTQPREGLNTQYRRLVWVAPEGVTPLGTYRAGRRFLIADGGGFRGFADALAPISVVAVSEGGLVAVSQGDTGEVLITDTNGQARRVLDTGIARRPVPAALVREYRDRLRGMSTQLGVPLRQLEQAFDQIAVPDSIPAIADLIWGTDGSLWAGARSGDQFSVDRYHVYDAGGSWIGAVEFPEEVDRLLYVDPDYLLVLRRDGFDVEYVDLYRNPTR